MLHRGRPYDNAEPRVIRLTGVAGDPATESALPESEETRKRVLAVELERLRQRPPWDQRMHDM